MGVQVPECIKTNQRLQNATHDWAKTHCSEIFIFDTPKACARVLCDINKRALWLDAIAALENFEDDKNIDPDERFVVDDLVEIIDSVGKALDWQADLMRDRRMSIDTVSLQNAMTDLVQAGAWAHAELKGKKSDQVTFAIEPEKYNIIKEQLDVAMKERTALRR